jgi:hypothetical protein
MTAVGAKIRLMKVEQPDRGASGVDVRFVTDLNPHRGII